MNSPFPSSTAAGGTQKNGTGARRWTRRLPWLGGALLVALIAAGLWPKPLPVEVAVVTRGDLAVTVNEEGMTRVKNRYVITSPVAGQLRRIEWKAGANVEAGKTELAVLESAGADLLDERSQVQAEARVRAAEAARDQASAQRNRAAVSAKLQRDDFARQQQLFKLGTLSRQEFETAEMRAATGEQEERAAAFAVQVAEFELAQGRALLLRGQPAGAASRAEPLVVKAPVSGRILRVLQESERFVPAGFPLLEIGDPTDLEARIEVLSRDGVAIQAGARVLLEQWGGPRPLAARVRWVEPSAFTKISALGVEEQRVYVVVDFTDPLEARPTLGDNFRVEARIVTWEGRDVLKAPAGALFQHGGNWQVFVIEGGKVRLRSIKVGHSNGLETEVIEGLSANERVVIYPGDKVADGSRVEAISVEAK